MGDAPAIRFVMHGARGAIAGGISHIEQYVKAIERAVNEDPGLTFDLAKALIESALRTILTERGIPFSPNDDTPKLFRSVTRCLPLLPAGASPEDDVRRMIVQTLSGLSTTVQGVCELRNACGFVSHGSGVPRPVMESVQAMLAAEAADAVVGFLFRVHRQDILKPSPPSLNYDDCDAFNAFVDDLHEPTRIFAEEFMPSRILFDMGPEPYRVSLGDFLANREPEEAEPSQDDVRGDPQ